MKITIITQAELAEMAQRDGTSVEQTLKFIERMNDYYRKTRQKKRWVVEEEVSA